MGGNLWAEISKEMAAVAVIFQEPPVTAAKFLRNAGNRRYFSMKNRRFRVVFSADMPLSQKKLSQNFNPGAQVVIYHEEMNAGKFIEMEKSFELSWTYNCWIDE